MSSSLLSFRCSPSPSLISFSSSKTLNLTLKRSCSYNSKSSFQGIRIQTPPPSSLRRNPSSSVKMMAKREEELKEIRAKTTEEINEEIIDLKGELFMLRLQKSARNEFKSSEFRRMRKRVWFQVLYLSLSPDFLGLKCCMFISYLFGHLFTTTDLDGSNIIKLGWIWGDLGFGEFRVQLGLR